MLQEAMMAKIRGQKLWAFSKSEIKHGFHNIISITQRIAAIKKSESEIYRLIEIRAKTRTK